MGTFSRTNAQKKQHKERSQPFNRARFGLLEKSKDYALRRADYLSKQSRLKALRSKAANKNTDEFYFGMINSATRNGQATKSRGNTALSQDVVKVLKTQDAGYIASLASMEREKIKALREANHLPGTGEQQVFVDTKDDLQSFDAMQHLGIEDEKYLDRRENRQRQGEQVDMSKEARVERKKRTLAKIMAERELASRQKRLEKLKIAERVTAVQRACQGKGSRKQTGVDKDGVPKYKWKQERKR